MNNEHADDFLDSHVEEVEEDEVEEVDGENGETTFYLGKCHPMIWESNLRNWYFVEKVHFVFSTKYQFLNFISPIFLLRNVDLARPSPPPYVQKRRN